MNTSRSHQAKIVNHDSGMGAPDSETVQRRASELAHIDGRKKNTEQDWIQAKQDLHGGHFMESNDNPILESVSERDMIASDLGHHIENIPQEDDWNIVEELIAEGMDEAVHEQMLEASKREED